MPMIRQNRLIPILGVVIFVVVAGILLKSRSPTPAHVPMTSVPQPPAQKPDADSPADTIRTLTAEVKAIRDENRKLRDDNGKLVQQSDDLNRNRTAIEENVTRRLTEQFSKPEASSSPVFSGLNRKIDDLAAVVQKYVPGGTGGVQAGVSDIPPGLGFDPATVTPIGAGTPAAVGIAGGVPGAGPSGAEALVWWEPLGSKTVVGPDGQQKIVKAHNTAAASPAQAAPAQPVAGAEGSVALSPPSADESVTAPKRKPYFTIPENATLMDATAMTALIGRTPVSGNVRDPMEFKVLIGRTNLAANGFEVPDDVTGMVMTGVAVGDWMLSCVEGHISSVTFVFQDGSINTVSRRSSGGATGNNNAQRLGFISDERGAPCLNGDKITNAPAYLTQIVGIKSLEVAARTAALSQTTTVATGLGSATSVTGSQGQFVLGQAAAAGVDEVSAWLMRRLNDSFDAVYVRPGAKVAVHLTDAIALDKDPNSRRLDYGHANRNGATRRSAHAQLD
jgi:integrating conjugative element protein (TIGR03752 family)